MNFTAIIITLIICCTAIVLADKGIKAKQEEIKLEIERRKTIMVQYRTCGGWNGYDDRRENETV